MIVANLASMHHARAAVLGMKAGPLAPVSNRHGGWGPWIHEPFTGAWQRNQEWTTDTVLAFHAVFACITLISQDVGKLRQKLVEQDANRIWTETTSNAFSPVLRRPNSYQNHIQFKEWWIISKLIRGNTYALKERDKSGIVRRLYLLDPARVKVLVAPDGAVFYELQQDNLSSVPERKVAVPASEIIHDRMNCLFHPLVGLSPIFASGVAADMGLRIQRNSGSFFGKGANPSGILTAPGTIDETTRDQLVEHWNTQFSRENAGAVAILGDGLKFEPMSMTSVDAQLIEQLKWSAETVCSTFHVPPFKLGIGPAPTYANAAEAENNKYYADCLQSHIESYELVMDEGLGIGEGVPKEDGKIFGVELDLDGLIRMDSGAQMATLGVGVGAGIVAPNEARKRMDLKPVKGGDSPMMQQQQFSLAALAERDKDKPFSKPTAPPPSTPANSDPPKDPEPQPDPEKNLVPERLRIANAVRTRFAEPHVFPFQRKKAA